MTIIVGTILRQLFVVVPIGKEHAVTSTGVGVLMRSRCRQEAHVLFPKIVGIETTLLRHNGTHQDPCELRFQRIFPRLQCRVVVDLFSGTPQVLFAVQDDVSHNRGSRSQRRSYYGVAATPSRTG